MVFEKTRSLAKCLSNLWDIEVSFFNGNMRFVFSIFLTKL